MFAPRRRAYLLGVLKQSGKDQMKTTRTNSSASRRPLFFAAVALLLTASTFAQAVESKTGKAEKALISRPVVAVLAFDYSGKDAALEPLTQGLAQMLISDLSKMSTIQVVERAQIQALLKEQKLVQNGAVEAHTAARIGKLLGARYLVLGSYFDLMKQMRLDARLVEVQTGKVITAVGQAGPVDDFWTLETAFAKKLEIALSETLPKTTSPSPAATGSIVPRPKFNARSAAVYGKALTALDKGDKREAQSLLERTVADNPKFTLAVADLDRLLR